jgi:DNA polymerase-3 subunit beta
MIRRTIFAAASESARYALTGVMWELNEDNVRLVATDGKRMAVVDSKGEAHNGHSTGTSTPVVPTKVRIQSSSASAATMPCSRSAKRRSTVVSSKAATRPIEKSSRRRPP